MMAGSRITFLAMFIILCCSFIGATTVARVVIDNRSEIGLPIFPADLGHLERLSQKLMPVADLIPQGSILITNESNFAIHALVVVWTFRDAQGQSQVAKIACDGYLLSPIQEIVPPHSTSLVTPHGCTSEESFESVAAGSAIGSPLIAAGRHSIQPSSTTDIHVTIDSVVFSNGEVRGPDTHEYYRAIEEREEALQAVLSEISLAEEHGQSAAAALRGMKPDHRANRDRLSAAKAHYVTLFLQSPNVAGTISAFRSRPRLPKFRNR